MKNYFNAMDRYAPSNQKSYEKNSYDNRRTLAQRLRMDGFEYFECIVGIKLKGGGPWKTGLCKLHDDQNPSFSVNEKGAYRCFACQASGGSIIDFHKMWLGMDFKAAIKDLEELGVYDRA